MPLEILEAHFVLNFKAITLKLGRGETIVEIKKFAFFGKMGIFQIKSQTRVPSVGKF